MDFYLTPQGMIYFTSEREAAILGFKIAPCEAVREYFLKVSTPPDPSTATSAPPCGSCDPGPVIRWLGVRWYGLPALKRWWRKWRHIQSTAEELKGCGCMVVPKNLWRSTIAYMKAIRVSFQ